jgi:hypothetical protein
MTICVEVSRHWQSFMSPSSAGTIAAKHESRPLTQTLFNIAWLSILLGLALEFIILVFAATANTLPGIAPIIADTVQKISWSGLVCTGLAVGKAASNANPTWMAFAGLISAPTALAVARTLHKITTQALKATEAGASAAFPFLIAGLRGIEYAALGLVLGWISKRASAGVFAYGLGGLLIGAIFGTPIAAASAAGGFATIKIIPALINEVFFPVGCSLAIFAADAIGKQMKGRTGISG